MYYANTQGNKFILPGRLRIGINMLKGNRKYAERINTYVAMVNGIKSVNANYYTGNVLVLFDERLIDASRVEFLINKVITLQKHIGKEHNNVIESDLELKPLEERPLVGSAAIVPAMQLTRKQMLFAMSALICIVLGQSSLCLFIFLTAYAGRRIKKYHEERFRNTAKKLLRHINTEKVDENIIVAKTEEYDNLINRIGSMQDWQLEVKSRVNRFEQKIVPLVYIGSMVSLLLLRNIASLIALFMIFLYYPAHYAALMPFKYASIKAYLNEIIFKDLSKLETVGKLDIAVFDKTGTLTTGTPQVVEIIPAGRNTNEKVLSIAASGEMQNNHPIAKALVHEASSKNARLLEATGVVLYPGKGITCSIEGKPVVIGSKRLMLEKNINTKSYVIKERRLKHTGCSPIFVAYNHKVIGIIAIRDVLRPESVSAIEAIRETGLSAIDIISGDSEELTAETALQLGASTYKGNLLPVEKAERIIELREKQKKVGMVGDGLSDCIAMENSDIAIAVTQIPDSPAAACSHMVVENNNLMSIPSIIDLSKYTMENIYQNYTISTGLSIIGIILALSNSISPYSAVLYGGLGNLLILLNSLKTSRYKMKYLDKQVN